MTTEPLRGGYGENTIGACGSARSYCERLHDHEYQPRYYCNVPEHAAAASVDRDGLREALDDALHALAGKDIAGAATAIHVAYTALSAAPVDRDGLREALMEPDDDGARVLFDRISSARRYASADPDVNYRPSMTDPEVIEALMVALDEVRERYAAIKENQP